VNDDEIAWTAMRSNSIIGAGVVMLLALLHGCGDAKNGTETGDLAVDCVGTPFSSGRWSTCETTDDCEDGMVCVIQSAVGGFANQSCQTPCGSDSERSCPTLCSAEPGGVIHTRCETASTPEFCYDPDFL
jgi:hypothetical protein